MTITNPVTIPAAPSITTAVVLSAPQTITAPVTLSSVSAGALVVAPLASWAANYGVSGSPVTRWDSELSQHLDGAGSARPTVSVDFKPGVGIEFDGVDDIIKNTSDGTIFPNALSGGSAIFVMRLNSIGANQVIFSSYNTISSDIYFSIGVNSSGKLFITWSTSAVNNGTATGATTLSTLTDYIVFIKTNGTIWTVYIDGVLEGMSYSISGNFNFIANKWFRDPADVNEEFLVGAKLSSGVLSSPFNGVLGVAEFWMPALSDSDGLAVASIISGQWIP